MASIINASPSNGIVQTADGSGVLKCQANGVTTNALAWVNFNGTTSPGTIRSAYNVGSVTKNGTGDYTVNFTNALTDTNYVVLSASEGGGSVGSPPYQRGNYPITSTSNVRLTFLTYNAGSFVDPTYCCAAIFGN